MYIPTRSCFHQAATFGVHKYRSVRVGSTEATLTTGAWVEAEAAANDEINIAYFEVRSKEEVTPDNDGFAYKVLLIGNCRFSDRQV